MNTPDHTSTIPWHIAQVYALTPTTIRTTADAQLITCAKHSLKTLETILKDSSLPIPNINHN